LILAGHGIIQSGAMSQVRALAERAQIPVACTLLWLGGFPASTSSNLGMMVCMASLGQPLDSGS